MSDWRDDKVLVWLDVFGRPDSSFRSVRSDQDVEGWEPRTEIERTAFASLVAEENRELLKAWYSQFPSNSPTADAFRRVLERATGEKLGRANKRQNAGGSPDLHLARAARIGTGSSNATGMALFPNYAFISQPGRMCGFRCRLASGLFVNSNR